MNPIKILFVAPLPPPFGGIANWSRLLFSYLEREKKNEVYFSYVDSSPKKWVTKESGLLKRSFDGGRSLLGLLKNLKRKLHSESFDLIHLTTSGSLGMVRDLFVMRLAKKKNVKVIYHIHFGRIPEILKKEGLEAIILKHNLKRADKVIVIDKATERSLEREYREKTFYIPNGIELSELPKPVEKRKNIVTFVGWVIKEKGVFELISAWRRLDSNLKKDWMLRVIGPYTEDFLEDLNVKNEADIEFTGRLSHEDTLHKINEGKVFVLPSYSEGFPYSVLEAMALCQTIIATDVGDMKEMLSPDCAHIIEPRSEDEVFLALSKALTNREDFLGQKAGRKVSEKYEISKIFEEYRKIYEG